MADRGVAVVRSRTNLAEDLKLCAIGPDGYSSSPRVVPGLGGALASELVLAERIGVESESVIVLDPTPTGDELVDELLAGLDDPDRGPVHLVTWIAGVGVGASPHIHSSLVSKRLLGAGPAQRPGSDWGRCSRPSSSPTRAGRCSPDSQSPAI